MKISKNKLFLFLSAFFLIGLFFHNIYLDYFKSLIVLFSIILIFIIYFLIIKKHLIIIFIITLWFVLWILLSDYNNGLIKKKYTILNSYLEKNSNVELEILDVYNIEDYETQYLSKVRAIEKKAINKDIFWLIILPSNMKLEKWHKISTKTKLYPIKNFDWFNYQKYLLSKNIYFKSYINSFEIIEKIENNFYSKSLEKIRKYFLDTINEIYTSEEGIFLWWILVWARESMPKSLKTDFNNSWLTHFIAVSWFNITILIIFLWYVLSYFPLSIRIALISFSIVSFTLLVWDTAPVIRAAIMWLVWYYILVSWRQWNSLSIILFTAALMVLFSPLSINHDVSFHLSFLAVIWIVYTQDFFKKIFHFLPTTLAIRESFVLTLSSLSFTLPIIIFNFWQISVLSPIANMLVTRTIPLAMLFWFLSIIVYYLFPILWVIIWYLTWILLKWDIIIVHYFGQSNRAILEFEFWILKNYLEILYFIILIFFILYFWWKKKYKWTILP